MRRGKPSRPFHMRFTVDTIKKNLIAKKTKTAGLVFWQFFLVCTVFTFLAAQSPTWTPECESANLCDGFLFRLVGGSLGEGDYNIYDWELIKSLWKKESGHEPAIRLPFSYPPYAFPLFTLYGAGDSCVHLYLLMGIMSALYYVFLRRISDGAFALISSLAPPAIFCGLAGQTGFLTGIALALIWLGLQKDHDEIAGLGLALCLFKIQYGLFIVIGLLCAKKWRILLTAGAILMMLTLLTGALYSFNYWPDWIELVTAEIKGNHPVMDTAAMSNWMQLFPPDSIFVRQYSYVPLFIGLLLTVWSWPVLKPIKALAVTIPIALFTTPHSHPYDLILWPIALCNTQHPRIGLYLLTFISGVALFGHLRWLLPIATLALIAYAWCSSSDREASGNY
jgi:hypothetical protein